MTTPKKLVHWGLDTSISDLGSPFSDASSVDSAVAGSSLQYINSQLISHGYTTSSGLSFEGLSGTDTECIAKCLLAMLSQRVNDTSRAEDLSTKLRTLTYDHERLTSMHRSAKEQAANAEREMNVHKSRLAATARTLHSTESTHKHTTAELQRTRTSLQALRAGHTSELKKKEREVERMTEKWTKLAEAQAKLGATPSGMSIRGANADVVTGSEVLWQGKTLDEEALEKAEQARAQLYEENGRLRRLILTAANDLQRVVYQARSLTSDGEEEPQPLTSVELFPIAPVGAANDKLAAMFTSLEDSLTYLPERMANGELVIRSAKASKSSEDQPQPRINLEVERLQGIIDSLQAELDETRKLHQAQAVETQQLYEQLSGQKGQQDYAGPPNGNIVSADEEQEELANLRVQLEEERHKLAKEKAAFEADRVKLRDEKRSFQADQMLSPPPQPKHAASTSRRAAAAAAPASPHTKSPPRKPKPTVVGKAKTKTGPRKTRVQRRSSASFNTSLGQGYGKHEPAYETEVIPETIAPAAILGVGGFEGALGAPAFELPKRRESILPTSFVLPPPSPQTALPPANSIPFSLLPPETPHAGYGEEEEGTTPATLPEPEHPAHGEPDGHTPPSAAPHVVVQPASASGSAHAPAQAPAPAVQTPARPFPRARTLAPHMSHAYSPAKPSPLSRILMLARGSPESPEDQQILAASRALGLAGPGPAHAGERSPEGMDTPIPPAAAAAGGEADVVELEESPLREKRAEANGGAPRLGVRGTGVGEKKTGVEKDRLKASTRPAEPAPKTNAAGGITTRLRSEKENRAKAGSKDGGKLSTDSAAAVSKLKSKTASAKPAAASMKASAMAKSTVATKIPLVKGGPRRVPIDSAEAAPTWRG